ncbi:MAG: UbiA prenyltransferase family protein [Deltaproteobacteria bacterium]|nr:UbiA prenyltransferase family protein [Deltaproteobacteria bacterium]
MGDLIDAMRPRQWIKNILVFAVLVFSGRLFDVYPAMLAVGAFTIFCALASAGYLFNDFVDASYDRTHPRKAHRPIPQGRLTPGRILSAWALLSGAGIWCAYQLGHAFGHVCVVYVVLQVMYSVIWQHVVIVDLFALAAHYVLRVVAGSVVIGVPMSPWLVICTVLLALFLALSSRAQDYKELGESAVSHRPVLAYYNPYLIDQMIAAITSAILITYTLYTISEDTVRKFGTSLLSLTIPFVLYGIFRYLYLIHQSQGVLSIERALFTDKPMRINAMAYVAVAVLIVYVVK